MMKKNYLLLISVLVSNLILAQTSGGPDAYGYTWKNSDDAQGPTYNWVDITTVGTEVTGLADDNSVGPIDMGMSFHYYWGDYSQIKIGSNGWLSFSNIGNIAHCFPTVPSAGGNGDNYLAPFMSDLNFTGVGNAGAMYYYHDVANQRFILSCVNAPWWVNSNPDYTGSNSYQVILSNIDSSITFQYQNVDAGAFNNSGSCASDMSIGMENQTGNIGTQLYLDALPTNNLAIQFAYPEQVLIDIKDLSPIAIFNEWNRGVFKIMNEGFSLPVTIGNVGNSDVNSNISVEVNILDKDNQTVFQTQQAAGVIAEGGSEVVHFNIPAISTAGEYKVVVGVVNGDDINPSNNIKEAELQIVDITTPEVALGFGNAETPDGVQSWTNGGVGNDGCAVRITPPIYPASLSKVQVYIAQTAFLTENQSSSIIEVRADDGQDGFPGTLLATKTIDGPANISVWASTTLDSPVMVNSGSVYLVWRMGGDSTSLGTTTELAKSRQGLELLSGSYGEFRDNQTRELLMKGVFTDMTSSLQAYTKDNISSIYPNPTNGKVHIAGLDRESEVKITNSMGQTIWHNTKVTTNSVTIDLHTYPSGIYLVNIHQAGKISTQRVVLY